MAEEKIKRVLIVDDEKVIRDFLTRLLNFHELMVQSADSGEAAIAIVKNNSFDIVFLDVRMPRMNGLETMREIKKIIPEATFVMMTGYAVDDLLTEAEKEGAVAAIRKPFEISEITEVIKNMVKA